MQVEGVVAVRMCLIQVGDPLSKTLLLAKRFAFLKECLFKGRNLLYQIIYLVQESVVIIPQLLDLLLQ